jgi:hypothetical protein
MAQTLQVTGRTGKDGVLHVSIPLGSPEADFDVALVVQPKATEASPAAPDQAGWSADYFNLAGSIDDATFVRPPQGELPKPVEMA